MKKTNRLISTLLVLAMLLSMAPITVFAAAAPPTVEIGGKTYYELDSADDLDWFAAQVNSGNAAINAALSKDITYNSGTVSASSAGARVWTPIGTRENPFTGIFNGQGYAISGLYSKDPEDSPYLSLVAHSVKATIANVAVTNFYFESKYGLVAGIASYAAGSTIYNCYAQGSIYGKDAGAAAAGICAAVFGHSRTEILNCLADVALKVDDPSDFTVSGPSVRNYIGGIICTGDKNNPVLIQKTIYITDRYNGPVYDSDYALESHFEIYDSEGMPASKLSTGEIAYALGNGWGQKLGTDPMPVILSADKVNYGYISCDTDAQKVYTNSATNPNYPDHYDSETDSDSACDFCGTNLHTHSFEYTAGLNGRIVATCVADGCTLENGNGGTFTISAPADLYADGITAKEATVENNLVDTSVAISDITYSAPYGLPPKDAGTYTASVTVGGATATVEFTLLNYAAKVTDKDGNAVGTYKTLADAITAASASEGSTVTLLDDVTLTEEQDISSGKLTLDLNGKTLLNETAAAICIESDADVTIKDSGEGGTIESKADTWNTVYNYGTLTVESGIIKGEGGISNSRSGTLNFKSGKIEADTYYAIGNYGTAYIYNGSFKSVSSGAIENRSGSTVYVYGGEFSGSAGIVNHSTAYIEGGEFTGNSYAALNLHGGTVEVTGGSFTGTDFASGSYSGTPYGEYTVYCNEGASLILKGGEFPNGFVVNNTTANTFLAEDYYYKDADGKLIDVADDAKIINGYVKVSKGADLSDAVITLDETQFTYSGMEHKPTVIVTVGGRTLAEGTDYTVSYANNINAGTATVTIKAVGQAAGGIAGGGEGNISNAGGADESVYTGEVTKEFIISRKPVTVTATAPDKVYDGTTDILEYSEITVTINGAVEGEMLGFTVGKAWYDSADAGEGKTVHIIYSPVASSSIDNYEFPANSEYSTDNYYVATTADISRKDISDGFIILGESLTYNGTEQTQTVEKVIPTGTAPEATYTVSGNKATNVGVYLLTVTGTGNFTGEAKLSYEIALDKKCVSHIDLVYVENNGVYERRWKVKSTDKESVQYVLDQLNNAVTDIAPENKKERWNEMKAACEEILGIINCVEEAMADVEKDYALYSEDTVKASDTDALNKIVEKVNEIKERYGYYLTEEEEKRLDDILAGVEKLRAKIAATAQEVADIEEAADVYNPDTVTSADKAGLEAIIADADAVNPENLTEEQKTALNTLKSELEGLIEKIALAGKAVEDIGAQLEMLDENRVTIFWEDEIEALKAKIDELLANTNMGEAEKAKLNEYKAQCDNLAEIIRTPAKYFSLRFFWLIVDVFIWVWNSIINLF